MNNKFKKIVLFPFRIFNVGDGIVNTNKKPNHKTSPIKGFNQETDGNKRINSGTSGIKISKTEKLFRIGSKDAEFLASVFAFIISTMMFLWIIAFIEETPIFINQFGDFNFSGSFGKIGIQIPKSDQSMFYQNVISKAICSSEIALIQLIILYAVMYSGIRLCLIIIGALSAGEDNPSTGKTSSIMSLAIICMPSLGILSTVVGILSADFVSREEAKIIIFGPSGIGISGFLIANFFYTISEYINEK